MAVIDEETRAEALDVLTDLLGWQMAAEGWEIVELLVESMALALAAGDPAKVRAATINLELVGPVRVPRIGADGKTPPPERVRDRVNRLVHAHGEDKAKPKDNRDSR